ncbi:MAG: folylpolyglutamate synthase/dihydrofolate synthase family protein [Thermoplasmatota archaeon]
MDYKQSINWLYSFHKYGSKLGLERISLLMNHLQNPQHNYKNIHITGTNGKGSVCKYIGSILQQAGYTVGVYISPHLQRFSERMSINGIEISQKDIAQLITKIKPIIEEMISQNNTPTFFEITTALAFQYFSDKRVEYAVIEVGLGGRFDATNILSPNLTIITNISLEHTEYLGKNVKLIAYEKAGIIKESVPVITAVQNNAKHIIEQVATEKNAPLISVDETFWKRIDHSIQYQKFRIQGQINSYIVETSMLGEYQGENIALSLIGIEQLQKQGIIITHSHITSGIAHAFNPGRMELISKKPMILLDGAHNTAGMKMLYRSLQQDFHYNSLILILGILKDKAIKYMLSTILPLADILITTQSRNPRACNSETLAAMITKIDPTKEIIIKPTISEAIQQALSIANSDDLVCISGSLFTVGEAREYITNPVKIKNISN